MARTSIARLLVAPLALAMLGAPCGTSGPQSRDFPLDQQGKGAVVIPMDNCYQRRDASNPDQTQSCTASGGADSGIFRAYGLVYFLLKKGIPVYWAIDGATPKATVTAPDLDVPPPTGGAVVVEKLDWATRQFTTFSPTFPPNTGIRYLGGPFVIDAADVPAMLGYLQGSDPDIGTSGRLPNLNTVDIHRVNVAFHANQVRPLSGSPPRLAILAINPKPYRKTSFDVMYRYAVAAGFNWPCTPGSGDCAGGLGPSCSAAVVDAYLRDTLCTTAVTPNCADRTNECAEGCSPGWVSPDITTAQFNPPGTPGLVYDVLCDDDFGNASVTYPTTTLATGGYKLLWAPHWDTGGVDAAATSGPGATLGQRLRNIASFVRAGGNLFAECAAIGALEGGRINTSGSGGTLLRGVPETQFQTTGGLSSAGSCVNSNMGVLQPFPTPQQPTLQIGDLAFPASGSTVNGAITGFYPDRTTASSPASVYKAGVQRLIHALYTNCNPACPAGQYCDLGTCRAECSPACAAPLVCSNGGVCRPPLDVATTLQVTTPDNVAVGTVAYLGGHDYSPPVSGSGGQTAGTRIVLNTLFNLGFGCADPDTACSTPYPSNSACGQGRLKCNPNAQSGLACVPTYQPGDLQEICGNAVDDDCDGVVDEGCAPVACTSGATRQCPADPLPANVCVAGTQTCVAGAWGECVGLQLRSPEACNGKDDDCNGQTDEGTLCPTGVCVNGVCLPPACDLESRCPVGYACTAGTCQAVSCGAAGACPTAQVCRNGVCEDPCQGVTCGTGATCSGGACFGGACYTVGCPTPGDVCRQGTCVADPCALVTCADGTFCRDGDCVRACAFVACPANEHCDQDGFCTPDCPATCAVGQVCQAGACVTDPCLGKGCGIGQVCSNGACIDQPCAHVTCPAGSACQDGQCLAPGSGSSATVARETRTKSGGCGCGSAGGVELLGGLLGVALWPRLRRRRPRPARGASPLLLLALAAGLGLGACGKSTRTEVCPAGSTDCGSLCCAAGFACVAGSCARPTGNPLLTDLSPDTAGVGGSVEVTVSGEGFLDGATARYSGAGLSGDAQLTEVTAGSGKFTLGLSLASEGTVEVRVVNPGGLVSNARLLSVTNAPVPTGLDRTSIAQDVAQVPVVVNVVGNSFVPGMVASLALVGGSPQPLPTTYVDGTHATVSIADPAALRIGVYDLTVAAPSGSASQSVKLAIVEGTPTLGCVTRNCVRVNAQDVGEVFGAYLYPTSAVYARPSTAAGASCADATPPVGCSALETFCAGTGAPVAANGQCQAGSLSVVIPIVPAAGDYLVEVVNPGAPPRKSSSAAFTVSATTCPAQPTCP